MPSCYTIVLYQNIYADATNKTAVKLEEFKVNTLSCSNWVDSCFGVVSALVWTRKEERTSPSPRKHWQLWRSQRAALDVIGTLRRTCVCERKAALQKVVQTFSRHDELSCFFTSACTPTYTQSNEPKWFHKKMFLRKTTPSWSDNLKRARCKLGGYNDHNRVGHQFRLLFHFHTFSSSIVPFAQIQVRTSVWRPHKTPREAEKKQR